MKQKIVKFMKCEIIVWNCKDLFIQESEPLFLGASVESAKLKKKIVLPRQIKFLFFKYRF